MSIISFIKEIHRRNTLFFYLALGLTSLFLIFLLSFIICQLAPHEICLWLKPFKFSLSFAIYAATLGWYMEYLKISVGEPWIKRFSWIIAALIVLEMGIILIQSVTSSDLLLNFDADGSLDRILYISGAWTILANAIVSAYIALQFFRETSVKSASYLWGIRAGFIICILSEILGVFLMVKYGQSAPNPNQYGIPLTAYSAKDNLVSLHFIGIHSLQLLPLMCYYMQKYVGKNFALSTLGAYAVAAIFFLFKA